MTTIANDTNLVDDGIARRNALILAGGQALGGANATIVVATGGIIGAGLAPSPIYATLPVTCFVLGQAIATFPASLGMRRIGRRNGFLIGAMFGLAGMLVAAYALAAASFGLFLVGTLLAGAYQAHIQLYRFAAADTASDGFRPKAISWVLAGGILAAIFGAQMVIWTRDLLMPLTFVGTFLVAAVITVVAIGLLAFLNAPPPSPQSFRGTPRPMAEIARQPRFIVAVGCAVVSYALMSFVMTAAPLAMLACNYGVSDAALAIQWHAMAMFAPSFFTGHLIARFGEARIMTIGLLMLAGCGVIALMGIDIAHFWGALILLGLGWNFGFIGATALLTTCYRPEERNKVQALNDLMVFGSVAAASALSGVALTLYGWESVNIGLFPAVAIALGLIAWLAMTERAPRTA